MRTPISVLVLGAAILLSFVLLGQYAPEAHEDLFDRFAIVPALITTGQGGIEDALARLFGHVFFHYGVTHVFMNGIAYVQVAPFVAFRIGDLRFLLLFFISALGGAAAFVLIHPSSLGGAVGASGAICGLYGAYFLAVRPTPAAALADPKIRGAMLSFLGINVVLMALLPLPIAWEAHLGGFIAGALAYPLLAPKPRVSGPWA